MPIPLTFSSLASSEFRLYYYIDTVLAIQQTVFRFPYVAQQICGMCWITGKKLELDVTNSDFLKQQKGEKRKAKEWGR
ncbi:hypothetical protein WQ57_12235 [Mesobacillus campisalis]|uniref:Uncharacterized protein n=1 Tax=Mesobacillus campisalis TaxID=1408103 RepID=A0A0M2SUA1_9BACI|nr:hypothetical protein WQ57_12235 [Mesobacillus campisalis]